MKKYLCISLLFVGVSIFAQERISKNLGDFNSLKVFSGLQVKLIKSTTPKIEIKGPQSEAVIVKNVNGLLKLSVKLPELFEADNTFVKLYYANDLEIIDANEGAIITADAKIIQDYLELKVQEGAQIELKLQVDILKLKSVTGGVIALLGKVNSQDVQVNTGGKYEGFTLQSKSATVNASTGGEVEIFATDFLKATAKLKGIIIYKTKPKKLIKKEVLGGELHDKNNYTNKDGSLIYSN